MTGVDDAEDDADDDVDDDDDDDDGDDVDDGEGDDDDNDDDEDDDDLFIRLCCYFSFVVCVIFINYAFCFVMLFFVCLLCLKEK